jgi:hypothetical protein
MIKEMVEAFADAKMDGAEMSVALYRVATDVGRHALIKQVNQQSRKAAEATLETAPVIKSLLAQCLQRWRARCVPCWRLDHPLPLPAKRESNSCFFVSDTWRPRQLSAFRARI